MKLNILIGGKAGQGINKISSIVSKILVEQGYFTFNYRDYQSLIRGGHNFNILCVSDERVGSVETKLDGILALDDKTVLIHNKQLKKNGFIIGCKDFCDVGKNLNIMLAGALIKILGIGREYLLKELEKEFNDIEIIKAAKKGYEKVNSKFNLKKLNNKIRIMNGSKAVALGAINSDIDLYLAYPMTPATGVLHELAGFQKKYNLSVFQPENEIAVVNMSLGSSFAGKKTMIGTSGGGFDLMTEGISMQGMAEIPLVVYLASRPSPGTGVPTYSTQADLDVALRGGHGEFPRVVIAPGDPKDCIEKTNEAFYLSEKFRCLSIVLSDKHLAESEFSNNEKAKKPLKVKVKRDLPGNKIVKSSSYEHDDDWNTTENDELTKKGADNRIKKYNEIKKECKKFEMTKLYGNKNAKNLVIGWGSTKTVILDALENIDKSISKKGNYRFLQVLYTKPLSNEIEKEIKKTKGKVILVENNVTGQLGRLIREKTGIKIEKRILKYDARPFYSDELKEEILKC